MLYCHLHGSATSSLLISYVTNATKHLVRERTGDLGSCWVRERVAFDVTESFKVGWRHAGGAGLPAGEGHGATPRPRPWDQGCAGNWTQS